MACKSKTHEANRLAQEGLYIQTALAHQVLTKALDEARAANPENPGQQLDGRRTPLEEAVERLNFGMSEMTLAVEALGRHQRRAGCIS